ncbi:DUF2059 domain-containing protein [Lysobacter sp. LF1]|uniref:DUF2059 domain-containing protein n=1 Tax=Lysobacter stagni TaxID=3045172 RepID=A0ABT6XCQ0_9GAMM|nr:DUF2059 domain-containing protein [Lysobacter sp. LF1]MDI9237923.1 DUF2059 domain-containing protein [Lysobacter sp. LF1]
MTRFLLALLLALATPLAHAAAPTDAQIDRLLDVMRMRQALETMLPQVEAMQQQMFERMTADTPMSAEQRALAQRILARTSQNLRNTLTWGKLAPIYRDVYRTTFDAQDMDAMIDFYGSAAGQRVLEKMPKAMQATMAATQTLVAPMMQQMQKDIAEELQQAQDKS